MTNIRGLVFGSRDLGSGTGSSGYRLNGYGYPVIPR
jgi:hypothetical protein